MATFHSSGLTVFSFKIIGHRFSPHNSDNLPLLVAIHTQSRQLPFNSCWNVLVLHNLPLYTNHIISRHPISHPPWWHLSKTVTWCHLYCVFTYIYSLYSLRKSSVIAETYQCSFHVFMCTFHLEISSFFSVRVSSFFFYFCIISNLLG